MAMTDHIPPPPPPPRGAVTAIEQACVVQNVGEWSSSVQKV